MGVVVGIDGSPSSIAALRRGRAEADRRRCELLVVHVAAPTEQSHAHGEGLLREFTGGDRSLLLTGVPGSVLAGHARDADLLVIGTAFAKAPFEGSTVSTVLHRVPCPLIVCDSGDIAGRMAWNVEFPCAVGV
ncbi:universal stress protein [Nonomuraea sp. NPDC050663]|uniref:universal stress protein n=1 Tax=Nonomuraea sp. NPDC050663 TaxID=3364370 RepID=UPI0037A91250